MPLDAFLTAAGNTDAREEIFTSRLIYDLKIAAAHTRDYHLLNYYSDVDHDGFDAIFDDRNHVERTQLKTVIGETTSWETIRKYLLRPLATHWECFYPAHFNSPGVEGSVIVTEITVAGGNATVKYWFTNVLVIYAISQQILNRPHATRTAATNLLDDLRQGASTDRVTVTKGMCVQAATPAHLLALMGLHTDNGLQTNWRSMTVIHADHTIGNKQMQLPAPLADLPATILGMIQTSSG